MRKLNKIKLIQLMALLIWFLTMVYFFGGDEVNGQEIAPESYQQVSDHRIAVHPGNDVYSDADGPEQIFINARVTAYAPFDNKSGICADENPNSTSTGKVPGPSYAAADPSRLPYGTKLNIPGYGIVEIQDTGGALRNYEGIAVDLYFETYEEAMQWGVQYLEVEILGGLDEED
jgi:3D (Asp-Asp-Asp) domain-containing protein